MIRTRPSNNLTIRFMATIVACLFVPAAFAGAGESYFLDDFESGMIKWQVGGDTWQETDQFYHSAGHSASESPQGDYSLNANSTITMKLQQRIDLSSSTQPVLTFWHRIGVQSGDYGYVEISQDNGFTWTVLTSFTNTHRSTWSRVQVDLSEYRKPSILIRFRLRDDGKTGSFSRPIVSSGWDIDDVEIRELDDVTMPFPMLDDYESDLDNWVFGGWQLSASASHSSSYSMADSDLGDYPLNACSDLMLAHPIDLSSTEFPVLAFWHRIGVQDGDQARVEVSQDNGFTWTLLTSFTDTYRSTWSREQVDLSAYKSYPILIRFRLRDDGKTGSFSRPIVSSGWDIDDVEIREMDTVTLPFPLFDDFESGLDNWISGGWQLAESSYRSQTHSMMDSDLADYPLNACSDLMLAHPIDLSSSVSPVLAFWHRIGVQDDDQARVEISQDNGFTWQPLDLDYPERSTFTNTWYADWFPELMDLSAYRASPILIRFRLRDDGKTGSFSRPIVSSGWDIDDVEIKELIYHPEPLIVQITNIDTSHCPDIQATLVVTDMDDEAVADLDASHFAVYENSEPQAPITVELATSSICASLALDYSGSMEPAALEALEIAAMGFVELMLPGDRGEIIKFAKGVEVMQEYTDDKNALIDAIKRPTTLDRSDTKLYDAIYRAVSDTAEQPCSKVVIVISDGMDNDSNDSATGVIDDAIAKSVPVFTIGLGEQIDEAALIAIATKTGGIYYFAPTPDDLVAIYAKIAGTLNTQYLVTYETTTCGPDSNSDVEHKLDIAVNVGVAYGQGAKRFHCPPSCDPTEASEGDTGGK